MKQSVKIVFMRLAKHMRLKGKKAITKVNGLIQKKAVEMMEVSKL